MLRARKVSLPPLSSDGVRILVDQLWPQGLTRQQARIDRWVRSTAPSGELAKWFAKNPRRWSEFKRRYKEELETPSKKRVLEEIRGLGKSQNVTLLYASENSSRNSAVALLEIVKNSS